MSTITLTVNDDGMVRDIKRACQLLRGVDKVKVDRHDITKTRGYQEAMEDLEAGRVTHWDSPEDFFKKMREDVQRCCPRPPSISSPRTRSSPRRR